MDEKNKKKLKIGIISASVVLGIYLIFSMVFMNRFYFGTEVNGIGIGGKTIEGAKDKVKEEVSLYNLELEGRDDYKAKISGKDIDLKFNDTDQITGLKDSQEPFKWVSGIFSKKETNLDNYVTYNNEKLEKVINDLSCFKKENIVQPKNPEFVYKDGKYEVSKEVMGNKIDKVELTKAIKEAISKDESTLDLANAKVYIDPKYTLSSPKVTKTKDELNKYVDSKITYTFGEEKTEVNSSEINKWLYVDSDLNPQIDTNKVSAFVKKIGKEHNTIGQGIDFKATDGRNIKVPGGNYGWQISNSEETQKLIADIKNGKTVEREPLYAFKALVHDSNAIGNTYVEIDMGKQHIWFYKDGSLITEGDIVTGNMSKNYGTPAGLYRLNYKQKDATLKGDDYETPVKYWMPFNGGIGLHDANWRNKFGGQIYKTSGSHGCVNLPPSVAEAIFNNISSGIPVVCYY